MKKITAIFLTGILVLITTVLSIEAQEDLSQSKQNKPPVIKAEFGDTSPVNDMLGGATTLTLSSGTVSVSTNNFNATKEANEPDHAENAGGASVWFNYTAIVPGVVRIKTKNNNFDTLLAVYTGANINNLTLIGWNDDCFDNCGAAASTVDLVVSAGQTYHIAIDGYDDGTTTASGTFTLEITAFTAPAADNFANSFNLGSNSRGSIAGTNFNATAEPGEPSHSFDPATKSVWYRWTPNATSSVDFELNENFKSAIRIYRAYTFNPTLDDLSGVAQAVDVDGFTLSRYRTTFYAESGVTYFIAVDGYGSAAQNSGNFQLKFYKHKLRYSNRKTVRERSILSVFRPDEGVWYDYYQFYGFSGTKHFGINGDVPVPADYDGNGFTDYAVTRSENEKKIWYINPSTYTDYYYGVQWGLASDTAITGDFDNDGVADLTAIRQTPNGLVWYVRQSSNGQLRFFNWGVNSDKPVVGDFDGDGATDVAVTRHENGGLVWYILKSGYGSGQSTYTQYGILQFGFGSDLAAPEDYDGDGKTDIAVFRSGNLGYWYILRSSDTSVQTIQFGKDGDKPQPADYDGDGKGEIAVFRPSNGTWYTSQNPATNYGAIHWGLVSDIPVSSLTTPAP